MITLLTHYALLKCRCYITHQLSQVSDKKNRPAFHPLHHTQAVWSVAEGKKLQISDVSPDKPVEKTGKQIKATIGKYVGNCVLK